MPGRLHKVPKLIVKSEATCWSESPVGIHYPTEFAKAGKGEPEDVVDVAQDVHQGDGNRDAEDVEVELGRLAGALVVEAVHIADHRVGSLKDGQPLPDHVGQQDGRHQELNHCPEQVGEEVA